jgi:DNA repair protein RadD
MAVSNELNLRDYQISSVEALRAGVRGGHRSQVLCAPTGSGKTIIAAYLMAEANRKFSRAAFVVDRVNLVDQTSAVLDSYGLDHGVIQAGHWRRREYERLQVCSAQTLEKRGFFPKLDLIIVDEAHCMRRQTLEFIASRPELKVLGLTATPFTKGLSKTYTNLVNVTTTNRLIADGHLVPLKIYAAKTIDMTGAKVVAGEWADKEIETRGIQIVGDIVNEWCEKTLLHFGGPVKTIVFSATVDHGEELCRQFNAAGYNFQQISYRDGNDERRREVIADFRKPDSEIHGLVSCEVFTKGFDVPDILCGISARPYCKSFSSHIQQMGRLMRTAPQKTCGLWLCHSGNALRFARDTAELFEEGVKSLDDNERDAKARKEPTAEDKTLFSCSCGFIFPPKATSCPGCGKERSRLSLVENVPGELVAMDHVKPDMPEYLRDKDRVLCQLYGHALDRKGGDVEAAGRFTCAQYKSLFGTWPRTAIADINPEQPHPLLVRKVQQQIIAWSRRKRAA